MLASDQLLAGRWADAPRLKAHVRTFLRMMDEGPLQALADLEERRNIDNARGVWLDHIGQRLGLVRPSVSVPLAGDRFGFDDAGVGFDQAPLRSEVVTEMMRPLDDDSYRLLIKARGITVLSSGTLAELERAIRKIDPNAAVTDNYDRSVTIGTMFVTLMTLARDTGAIAANAGVRLIIGEGGGAGDNVVSFRDEPVTWRDENVTWR